MGQQEQAGTALSGRADIVIVAARYNEPIVGGLLRVRGTAWAALGGVAQELRVERVPGAFELPLAARAFALAGRADAIVALGCGDSR